MKLNYHHKMHSFNKLSGSSGSDIEYAHASRVWDAFGCETIAETIIMMYIYTWMCCCLVGFLREIPKNLLGFLQS